MREKLILVPSERMDNNRKKGRNENSLVRMSKACRDLMGFEDKVEIYPETDSCQKRMKGAMLLDIFQAFSSDIKKLREDGFSADEISRVGFVTTRTYNRITDGAQDRIRRDIWIADDIHDTVVGADPEFLLFEKNTIIRANNVLGYNGLLGCDGAMAEVRPHPAISPEKLADNIKKILQDKRLTDPIKKYKWIAGCYFKDDNRDYPIGGHIHVGNPIQIARLGSKDRENFFKVMNKILDELLAIPLIKIDGSALGKARRTECTMGKYGYFGELRTGHGRLEHRTLSGMWLMHPTLSINVLGVAKAIIDEVYRHTADMKFDLEYMYPDDLKGKPLWSPDFNSWGQFPLATEMGCTKSSKEMIELLHKSAASKITAQYMKDWYSHMRKMSTYGQYGKYIDALYEILKNNSSAFHKCDKNIKRNWLNGKKFIGE